MSAARFLVEKHTDDRRFCFRVVDTKTGEKHGFGLTAGDALHLAVEHAIRAQSEGAL